MNLLRALLWIPFRMMMKRIPLGEIYFIGKIIGALSYLLLLNRRRSLFREFSEIFPERGKNEIGAITFEAFRKRSITELENMSHDRITPENIDQLIDIDGLEHIDGSLKKGKGIILCIAHFGAYLQVLPALGHKGYKVNQLANELPVDMQNKNRQKRHALIDELLFGARFKASGNVLPVNIITAQSFIRPLFRCLKDNEILVMAIDGRTGSRLSSFEFLNYETYWFSTGPISLAIKTKASLIPSFVVRKGNYKNEMTILPPMDLGVKNTDENQVLYHTQKFIRILETYVKRFPEQYGMEILYEKKRLVSIVNKKGHSERPDE